MSETSRSPCSAELTEERLLGVVLAGGRSSRMGTDKALLPHPAGGTFLTHAVDSLQSLGCPVVISGSHTVPGWRSLPDPVADRGPAVGVARALQAAEQAKRTAALIMPVDMPWIGPSQLRQLVACWREQPSQLVAATFDDEFWEPLLAIYLTDCLASLQELAESPHRSLARWLSQQACRPVSLPTEAGLNLNTAAEWQAFSRSSKSSESAHRNLPPD